MYALRLVSLRLPSIFTTLKVVPALTIWKAGPANGVPFCETALAKLLPLGLVQKLPLLFKRYPLRLLLPRMEPQSVPPTRNTA